MTAVSTTVYARNDIGQFISGMKEAATRTVQRVVQDGADLSTKLAPVGAKPDPRSIPIKDSIVPVMTGRTSGLWFASARHAGFQEYGTAPHTMYGSPFFYFFWEEAGRMWEPGLLGPQDIINHPGNPAQPFMMPAYRMMKSRLLAIARQEYAL